MSENNKKVAAYKDKIKEKYDFWETQPVVQFTEELNADVPAGPIEVKTVDEIRTTPLNLPASFEWCSVDFNDEAQVQEVYDLLHNNYVEDDECMFRFSYAPRFLKWALQPPGYEPDWLIGVRVKATQKLVGFISGVPAEVRAGDSVMKMAEINFLCVHKKLRAKRLAPVLIKEVTRRVNIKGIWQAAYTAGVLLPRPLATCRYWHRSLNPKKLIDIRFSHLSANMTLTRLIKLNKLPAEPTIPNVREMCPDDAPAVAKLLNGYLSKFKVAQVFTPAEVTHWLQNLEDVVQAYVVESSTAGEEEGEGKGGQGSKANSQGPKEITDLFSFYSLPSSVLGHPHHKELRAAYMYYTVPGKHTVKDLLQNSLIMAHAKGYDVFNALDLCDNGPLMTDLKFGVGDGELHYYLYNWRLGGVGAAGQLGGPQLKPSEVGLILM
uniref:Glycylpeptide N-tetradecanoyltransferase n=1 Tax=Polytomella parva TaxID=51329 RepID=A0A7S0VEK5_9CHLO